MYKKISVKRFGAD